MIEVFNLSKIALEFSSDVKLMDFVVDVVLVGETFANFVTSRPSILLVYPNVLHLKYVFLLRRDSCPTPTQARQQYYTCKSQHSSNNSYSYASFVLTNPKCDFVRQWHQWELL